MLLSLCLLERVFGMSGLCYDEFSLYWLDDDKFVLALR